MVGRSKKFAFISKITIFKAKNYSLAFFYMQDRIVQLISQLFMSWLVLLWFIYYFSRYRRISVKIWIWKDHYKLWEEIRWVIKLNIKKQLTVQSITIKLQWRWKDVEMYHRRSNKKVTDFFEKEYFIEGVNNYLKWSEPNFNFSIKVPDMLSLNWEWRAIMKEWMSIWDFMNNPIDNYKGVLYFWDVRATVTVAGMSFSDYKTLNIS